MKKLAGPLLALVMGGCLVVVDDGKPHHTITNPTPIPTRTPAPPPPPPPVAWVDCRTGIYREYFDCDWGWIGAVRRLGDQSG